jgi:GT2 family glycosyltransferase
MDKINTMDQKPKIAIVYLAFYAEAYLDDVVCALKSLTYPKDRLTFIIVDNPHPEKGNTRKGVEEKLLPISGLSIPEVVYLPQEENLGFARGNNIGVDYALKHDFDYIYFHNDDGYLAADVFEPLLDAFAQDKSIALTQSLIMLHPETDRVNTSGNRFHFLGFGYSGEYRTLEKDLVLAPVSDIGYASGSGLLVSTAIIRKYGAWDEDFFMYHEDTDWSLRLRSLGYRVVVVRASKFFHKYQFSRSIQKLSYIERNRYGVMLLYFRWPTLLLLLPLAFLIELGLIFFAFRGGWLGERVKLYRYWLQYENWKKWLLKRKKIQKMRTVGDRTLFKGSVSGIHFQDASTDNFLVNYLANPIMKVYYYLIVKCLIWW